MWEEGLEYSRKNICLLTGSSIAWFSMYLLFYKGTWFCALKFKQRNSIWISYLILVGVQWYRHFIAPFYLTLQKKVKMVHNRTPYTTDALKSVQILTTFNASCDVTVLTSTCFFYLPGDLMPSDIIICFAYLCIYQTKQSHKNGH